MKFLVLIGTALIAGYIGYKAGRKIIESSRDELSYEYHGKYDETNGEVYLVRSTDDFLKAFTMTIFKWIDINERMGNNYVEILIGRDNAIIVERHDLENRKSQYMVSLLYKNIRYAKWCTKRSGDIIWYDNGVTKLNMYNTGELLDWFCKEGVISWRVKKTI